MSCRVTLALHTESPPRKTSSCGRLWCRPRPTSPSCTQSWTSWRTFTQTRKLSTKGEPPLFDTHALLTQNMIQRTVQHGACVSLQRNRGFEEDAFGVSVVFQSDTHSPVSLSLNWWSLWVLTFRRKSNHGKFIITHHYQRFASVLVLNAQVLRYQSLRFLLATKYQIQC